MATIAGLPATSVEPVLVLLRAMEMAVLGGSWLEPRREFPLGIRLVRLVARDDEMLGIEEQTEPGQWAEQVDRALAETLEQISACRRVGLPMSEDRVYEFQVATVQPCALESEVLVMERESDVENAAHSGWRVLCGTQHHHEEESFVNLSDVIAAWPAAKQFLMLPRGADVIFQPPSAPGMPFFAEFSYQGQALNSGDLIQFPEPDEIPWVRGALLQVDAGQWQTGAGRLVGLPDVVAKVSDPVAAEAAGHWIGWVLDDIQQRISQDGFRYTAGQTIHCGARTLRVIERFDGTIGLEERIAGGSWSEQVDNTLREQWQQRQILKSLGAPEEWLQFPADDQTAMFSECVTETSPALRWTRLPQVDDAQFSGWRLTCPQDHDHGAERVCALWGLTELFPFLIPFLALPPLISVTIDIPDGDAAARFDIQMHGVEFLPEQGSYLDGLNRTAIQR
ncbi:hypothetical protein [Nocardia callitridis]|uniref:hypothetical protein n=1 Tax=Nocardia callitridis TaxID=648753 RepID=UPI0031EE9BF8